MNEKLGKKSITEILEQGEAWEQVLSDKEEYAACASKLKEAGVKKLIFVGCGSSYYIGLAGSFIFTKLTGMESTAVPASEIIFFSDRYIGSEKTAVAAVSRSGKTTETVKAVEEAGKKDNVVTLGLTCHEESKLAQICDHALFSRKGKEKSVVMTKSFTSLLFAIQLLAGLMSGDEDFIKDLSELSGLFDKYAESWDEAVREFTSSAEFDKHVFLGHGSSFGLANEAMLKMKEMAITSSEVFHGLEFRHGPKSIVDKSTFISAYLGQETYESEIKVCREMVEYGAALMAVCNKADDELRSFAELVIEFQSSLSDYVLAPLALVPNQFLAFYSAVNRGIDPDQPRNLTQVVEDI